MPSVTLTIVLVWIKVGPSVSFTLKVMFCVLRISEELATQVYVPPCASVTCLSSSDVKLVIMLLKAWLSPL